MRDKELNRILDNAYKEIKIQEYMFDTNRVFERIEGEIQMKDILNQIADYLVQIPIMNRDMMIGIIGRFETRKQCEIFLSWIKEQDLKNIKEETMLIKSKKIQKNY